MIAWQYRIQTTTIPPAPPPIGTRLAAAFGYYEVDRTAAMVVCPLTAFAEWPSK